MSLPLPVVGSTNVRGFVLPQTCSGSVCALPSLYGDVPVDRYNPLVFFSSQDLSEFAVGTEIYFDVAPGNGTPVATNIRAAL